MTDFIPPPAEANSTQSQATRKSNKTFWQLWALLSITSLVAWSGIHYLPPADGVQTPEASANFSAWVPAVIRLAVVVAAIVGWYATQYLIGTKAASDPEKTAVASRFLTDSDLLLRWSEPLNRYLNARRRVADWLLILSSAIIDQLGVFLLVSSIVGPSVRPLIGLLIVFALRQICQALTALPPPVGMIWRNPGFPSIFVTYGVANDLFFSGHTALAVYGAWELAGLGHAWLAIAAAAIAIFQIATVLVLRAHYTMDVFAGTIAALFAAGIAARVALAIDHLLALS